MGFRKFFLTVGYSGLSPKAPGTAGSFVALIFGVILLQFIDSSTLLLLSLLVTVIAIKQIDIYEKEVGLHDSDEIVIDELAGMWLALSICGINSENVLILAPIAFVFFRIFDIWKPSIIGKIDADVKGGLGVMGDDIVAGIFAGICTAGVWQIVENFLI